MLFRPVMVHDADTCEIRKWGEAWLKVNEIRMLSWLCGVTRKDVQEYNIETSEMVRPCDVEGRGTHIERSDMCGNARKETKREAKPSVEGCV